MVMLLTPDFDANLLASLRENKATLHARVSQESIRAVKSALVSNIRAARIEAINEFVRLDNELAYDDQLETLERIYDLEKRYGIE
mgnify:CR=1 FL=1